MSSVIKPKCLTVFSFSISSEVFIGTVVIFFFLNQLHTMKTEKDMTTIDNKEEAQIYQMLRGRIERNFNYTQDHINCIISQVELVKGGNRDKLNKEAMLDISASDRRCQMLYVAEVFFKNCIVVLIACCCLILILYHLQFLMLF
jgi:hypothetical protein